MTPVRCFLHGATGRLDEVGFVVHLPADATAARAVLERHRRRESRLYDTPDGRLAVHGPDGTHLYFVEGTP